MVVSTGTYTGDGNTGLRSFRTSTADGPFQPEVVWVVAAHPTAPASSPSGMTMWHEAVAAHSASTKGSTSFRAATGFTQDEAINDDGAIADGFTIGDATTTSSLNTDAFEFFWIAMAFSGTVGGATFDDTSMGRQGVYRGTGSAQTIEVGFQPDWIFINSFNDSLSSAWVWTSSKGGDNSQRWGEADSGYTADHVTAVTSTGFTLGAAAGSNDSGEYFGYLALKAVPGCFRVGTYTGDGNDDRTISMGSGVGTGGAECVMVKKESATDSHMVAVTTPELNTGSNRTTQTPNANAGAPFSGYLDLIQDIDLSVSSFQVGTHDFVNENTEEYHWMAFAHKVLNLPRSHRGIKSPAPFPRPFSPYSWFKRALEALDTYKLLRWF